MKLASRVTLRAMALAVNLFGIAQAADALPVGVPSTTEIDQYLIVGMKQGASGDAFNTNSSNELGADQEVLSFVDPKTRDVFAERWTLAGGSATAPPPPAAPVFQGIDWSGNVALTSPTGRFSLSDIDVYAALGVRCATTPCDQSVMNTSWFPGGQTTPAGHMPGVGVSAFDPNPLLGELAAWKAAIQGLTAEATITSNIENRNSKPGNLGPLVTDLNAVDSNGDRLAVIDIVINDGHGDFVVNASEWILQGSDAVSAIFRVRGKSNVVVSQSSILLGDGGIGGGSPTDPIARWGALFFKGDEEGSGSSDEVFNLSNVVLNGVALWDLSTVGDTGTTEISLNDGQGCAQFIGSTVTLNDVRWNRCSAGAAVPEASSLVLLGSGLVALVGGCRRLRRSLGKV